MSNLGAQAARARRADEPAPSLVPPAREWRGHVQRSTSHGTEWVRVAIPQHIVDQYLVELPGKGRVQPPNMRSIVIAMIETELSSDAFIEARGWPK